MLLLLFQSSGGAGPATAVLLSVDVDAVVLRSAHAGTVVLRPVEG